MPFGDIGVLGYWDPTNNIPQLTSGKGDKGDAFICSGAGTTDLDGIHQWNAGDLLYFGLDRWEKAGGRIALTDLTSVIQAILWIGDEPPPPPIVPGKLWFESDSGNLFIYYDDGTSMQWVQISSHGEVGPTGAQGLTGMPGLPGSAQAVLSLFVSGPMVASETLFQHKFTLATTFAAAFAGSQGIAQVPAAASAIFSIAKNDIQVGTATFGANGTVPTFASATPTTFNIGDILTIVGPPAPDGTLANVSFSLLGAR